MKRTWRIPGLPRFSRPPLSAKAADDARTPLYFQDPSGAPFYAAGPKKTPDGRDYVPVFDDAPPGNARRQRHHRDCSAAFSITATPWACRTPHRCRKKMPWAWITSRSMPTRRAMRAVSCASAPAACKCSACAPRRWRCALPSPAPFARPARCSLMSGALRPSRPKSAGWIERLTVAATGDPVQPGQVLAELYAPDLVAAEAGVSRRRAYARAAWRMAIGCAHNRFAAAAARARCARR